MAVRLAVLGGSSPFTASFVDALAEAADHLPKLDVTLFGRDRNRADLIAEYARSQFTPLGWRVRATDSLPDCLQDSSLVLHQIRYGGLLARRSDEILCDRFGIHYDETLGLGALSALLRTALLMQSIANALARYAPHAWIVNLTNPLSAVTTLLTRDYGLERSLGVCELPTKTAAMIAAQIGVRSEQLSWSYTGLNHRGFVHDLTVGGDDVFRRLLTALGQKDFLGTPAAEIAVLNAVPLKYHQLLGNKSPPKPSNRANELLTIGDAILAELRHEPHTSPQSLAKRDTSWYREAVVPVVRALLGHFQGDLVASLTDDDGVAWERKIVVQGCTVKSCRSAPPREVEAVLSPLVLHEKAAVNAARTPVKSNIVEALSLDPLVPRQLVEPVAGALIDTAREQVYSS